MDWWAEYRTAILSTLGIGFSLVVFAVMLWSASMVRRLLAGEELMDIDGQLKRAAPPEHGGCWDSVNNLGETSSSSDVLVRNDDEAAAIVDEIVDDFTRGAADDQVDPARAASLRRINALPRHPKSRMGLGDTRFVPGWQRSLLALRRQEGNVLYKALACISSELFSFSSFKFTDDATSGRLLALSAGARTPASLRGHPYLAYMPTAELPAASDSESTASNPADVSISSTFVTPPWAGVGSCWVQLFGPPQWRPLKFLCSERKRLGGVQNAKNGLAPLRPTKMAALAFVMYRWLMAAAIIFCYTVAVPVGFSLHHIAISQTYFTIWTLTFQTMLYILLAIVSTLAFLQEHHRGLDEHTALEGFDGGEDGDRDGDGGGARDQTIAGGDR